MTGPLAVYAGSGGAVAPAAVSDQAWSGGGAVAPTPSTDQAWSGGGVVGATEDWTMPGGVTQVASLPSSGRGDWAVQVGAFPDPSVSMAQLARAHAAAGRLLGGAGDALMPVQRGELLYRARLTGLSQDAAAAACAQLQGAGMDCFTVPPGS